MIGSYEEFLELLNGGDPAESRRIITEPASDGVWREVIMRSPESRRWVAQNKTLPESLLGALAADDDPIVRWTVASRRSAPIEVLRTLAGDPDETVRRRVASNARTPLDVLGRLANDRSDVIREAAERRLRAAHRDDR